MITHYTYGEWRGGEGAEEELTLCGCWVGDGLATYGATEVTCDACQRVLAADAFTGSCDALYLVQRCAHPEKARRHDWHRRI